MDASDIGVGDHALLCHTDKPQSNWTLVLPCGTEVQIEGTSQDDFQEIEEDKLYASIIDKAPLQKEDYSDVEYIPDSRNVKQIVYVNIGIKFNYNNYYGTIILIAINPNACAVHILPLNVSEPTSGVSGETKTITCSARFVPYPPPPVDVNFAWYFRPGISESTLPPGVKKSNAI